MKVTTIAGMGGVVPMAGVVSIVANRSTALIRVLCGDGDCVELAPGHEAVFVPHDPRPRSHDPAIGIMALDQSTGD